jgi:hypothetical protein
MANAYNVEPIYLDTVMASGWRALQTLKHDYGIRVFKVLFHGGSAASSFTIIDPTSSNILLQGQAAIATDVQYDFDVSPATWKDFELSAIAGTGAFLLIWYRD